LAAAFDFCEHITDSCAGARAHECSGADLGISTEQIGVLQTSAFDPISVAGTVTAPLASSVRPAPLGVHGAALT
jgi:hypothetical protein